jgi:cell division protein FtsB
MRLLTLALAALLVLVQAELWLGRSGLPRVVELRLRLDEQRAANAAAARRNQQLDAEVRDLKDGHEMVEEKARYDLGMVKPDEILVQVAPKR